jgi:hypothetical protein
MRPGQLTPNALESAILLKISATHPAANLDVSKLNVLSREYTGVGSYTTFSNSRIEETAQKSMFDLPGLIEVAGVAHGMGAILWMRGGRPDCLEIYTYGPDNWDGTFESFSLHSDGRGVP